MKKIWDLAWPWLVRVFLAALTFLLFYHWFLIGAPKNGCPLSNSEAWCDVHPFEVVDGIGIALYSIALLALFGVPIAPKLRDKLEHWYYIGLVVIAFIGILFITEL